MRKIVLTLLVGLSFVLNARAQERTVSGKVSDASGNPVSNASVLVVGTNRGTSTAGDGTFSIAVPTSATALNISAVNFQAQRVSIRNISSVTVTLAAKAGDLDEVVVTGIKNVRRAEFAGAASRINKEVVENKPVGSFDQLLQGAAPGLLALTGSGQPGTSANIIIRGQNSIAGGTNPLYIVDGIQVEASTFQGLNPNDFQTVEVLKDASSTALYGSRGGAGVIVVTTKRGVSGGDGKMRLGYNTQMGIKSKPEFAFSPMSTSELLQAQFNYGNALNQTSSFPGSIVLPGWYYSPNNPRYATLSPTDKAIADTRLDSISRINTDWNDYMFRNGTFSNHELVLSGGTGKTRIYSSLGLYNEEGVTNRTDMRRISLRNNIDFADDKFTFSLSSAVAYTKRNFQQSTTTNSTQNPFLAVNITTPYARVYKDDGTLFTGNGSSYSGAVAASFVGANQLDYTLYDRNYNDQIKTVFGANMGYKLTQDFSLGLTAGADFRETQGTNYGSKLAFLRTTSTDVRTRAGFQTEALTRFFTVNVRPSLNYRKNFAEKHVVDVSLIGEMKKEYAKSLSFTGYGIDPRTPNTPAAITAGDQNNQLYISAGGGKSQNSLFSGLVMGSYTFDKKYTFTGSYRKDGSSKLYPDNRWQDFYAIGGIWTVSNESFLKNSKVVNNLRLRASYGGAGNENNFAFGDFGAQPTWAANGNYSGLTTMFVSNYGNPDLVWESTWTTNIGTDFGLFNNRLNGSIDFYNRVTKDLLVQNPLAAPAAGGPGSPVNLLVNAGELSNKGFEADLSYDVIKNSKLTWTIRGNVGYNKNEILSLGGVEPYPVGTSQVQEGLPLGSHFEVGWAGVDQATGAPLYYKKDGTITTAYSANDKVQTWGTWEAPWKGGFGTSLRYNQFDLSVLFTWQEGATKMDNLEYFVENPVGFLANGYNQSSSLNFWTKPGDIASTPSPLYATNFSSKLIHDASFLRLRDVTLSYTLPADVLKRTKFISKASFFVQGSNLFMWTKWRGMDPEAGPVNINLSEFPNPRAVTGGVSITF